MDRKEELRQWFSIADTDLAAAEHLFHNMYPIPGEIICFHCQQSVEKYLKGYLFLHEIEPPKVHDLILLVKMCLSLRENFSLLLPKCGFVNRFSVIHRYPNQIEITDEDVRIALQYAKDIKEFVSREINPVENDDKQDPPNA